MSQTAPASAAGPTVPASGPDTWWVVIPQQDQGKSTSYLESVDFRVQYQPGSPGDKAMQNRKPYNDPNFGQTVVYWQGPFATEADAKTAQNPQPSPNPLKNIGNLIPGVAQIGDFFAALGQASTWVRLGEGLLGLILVAVGVARLTHAVPVATKVAKTVGAVGLLA